MRSFQSGQKISTDGASPRSASYGHAYAGYGHSFYMLSSPKL
jgi:hypothetical protein